jgi:hypothetical protein
MILPSTSHDGGIGFNGSAALEKRPRATMRPCLKNVNHAEQGRVSEASSPSTSASHQMYSVRERWLGRAWTDTLAARNPQVLGQAHLQVHCTYSSSSYRLPPLRDFQGPLACTELNVCSW